MQNVRVVEQFLPIWACAPNNYTGAANTVQYASLKGYERIGILITTGAWAGGTAAVTMNQATAVAGTGAKALAIPFNWTSTSTSATVTKNTVVSNTFNLDTANKLYWLEFVQSDLDVANNFTCVGVSIASPGGNNDYYSVTYFGCYPKYPMPVQVDPLAN